MDNRHRKSVIHRMLMEGEDVLKFTNSVILLAKLTAKIEDKFFVQKLHGKILDMVNSFIRHKIENQSGVSHNIGQRNLVGAINNILDFLEYLGHDLKNDATPLLLAQRNLLKFKLHILKQKASNSIENRILGVPETSGISVSADASKPKTSRPNLKIKLARSVLKSDSNKEKIFNFVKKFPDVRTKEILDEFNILSGRTVKRNLKELTDGGFLNKKSDGIAVYYTVGHRMSLATSDLVN